jgi:hypothetical protein
MIPDELLTGFETAQAPGSEDVLFKQRYDTKYVFPASQLPGILRRLSDWYRISCFENRSSQIYESIYFDDAGRTLYQEHQRGKLRRYKIRMRFYPATDFACLEIKMKTNRHTTWKWRRRVPREQFEAGVLTDDDRGFMERIVQCPHESLEAMVRVRFTRLALKSKESGERVTLDRGLEYVNPGTGATKPAGDFIVAEVKQARPSLSSPFRRLMRGLRIAPVHFSKYCYGIYLFHPDERHNRLKRNYLALERKKNLWLTLQIL